MLLLWWKHSQNGAIKCRGSICSAMVYCCAFCVPYIILRLYVSRRKYPWFIVVWFYIQNYIDKLRLFRLRFVSFLYKMIENITSPYAFYIDYVWYKNKLLWKYLSSPLPRLKAYFVLICASKCIKAYTYNNILVLIYH